MNIIHISDIHIKNNQNIDDYEYVFGNIYDTIISNKIDVAVFTGDLAHTKNQLSPEYFYTAGGLLYNVSNLVKHVIIILGNHDVSPGRLDAVTPVVNLLKKKNIVLLINNNHIIDNINFINHSCFVKKHNNCLEEIKKFIINDKVNILLYHGLISGCVLNNLYTYTDINKFSVSQLREIGVDFGFFGDVHKNQFLSEDKKFAYAGCIMQQNHGEYDDKNVIIYNIIDSNNYEVNLARVKQKVKFVTLCNEQDVSNFLSNKQKDEQYCVRFIGDNIFINYAKSLSFDKNVVDLKYVVNVYKECNDIKFNIKSLGSLDEQNKFICEYIDFIGNKRFLERKDDIIKLNVDLDSKLSVNKNSDDNEFYNTLQCVRWKNFGCYSDGYFDFKKSNFYGLISENSKGKTTFIDVILYAIFGNSTKGNKCSLINNNHDYLETEINIISNNNDIKIYRYLDRNNIRKLSIEINGHVVDGSKRDLNNVIEKYFGQYEDFMATNCISQFDTYNIVFSLGPKKRMEKILVDYGFEKLNAKYLLAKNEVSLLKREVNKLNSNKADIGKLELDMSNLCALIDNNKKQIKKCDDDIKELQEKLWSSVGNLNINLNFDYNKYIDNIAKLKNCIQEYRVVKNEVINKFDIAINDNIDESIKSAYNNIINIKNDIARVNSELDTINEYERMAYDFDESCDSCPLYSKYMSSCDRKNALLCSLDKLKNKESEVKDFIEKMNSIKNLLNKVSKIKNDIMLYYNIIAGDLYNYAIYNHDIVSLFRDTKTLIEKTKDRKDKLQADNNKLMYTLGKLQQEINITRDNISKISKLTDELNVYELYEELMSPDNLQKEIFNNVVKLINNVISNIMQQFKFVVKLVVNDDGLDVNVVYADGSTRDINLCSGMERTMANVVIRLAMLKLRSNYNVIIFDETFSYFDSNNIDMLNSLFDYIKREGVNGYKTILVTHDLRLKDNIDYIVNINYDSKTKMSSMFIE